MKAPHRRIVKMDTSCLLGGPEIRPSLYKLVERRSHIYAGIKPRYVTLGTIVKAYRQRALWSFRPNAEGERVGLQPMVEVKTIEELRVALLGTRAWSSHS